MPEKFEVTGNVNIEGEVVAEKKKDWKNTLDQIITEQKARGPERRPEETPEQFKKRMGEDELGLKYKPESDNPPGSEELTGNEDGALKNARQEAEESFEKS